MTNEEIKAREMVERVFELRRLQVRVSPSWIATEVMQMLDPARASHPVEYAMAHLQFRQLARAICAGRWDKETSDETVEQHDLFPILQTRYPVSRSRGEEPQYVLLEYMTDEDVGFNVTRLRSEAIAKLKHADALEAWGRSRVAA
jgi:hypothetical protein